METIYENGESDSSDYNKDEYDDMSTESSNGDEVYNMPQQPKINKESALIRQYEAKINDLTKIIDTFKTKKNVLMETRLEDTLPEFELKDPFGYRPYTEKELEYKGPPIDYDQAFDSSDGYYGVGSAPTNVCVQIEENNRRLINELEKCEKRVMSGTRKRNTPSTRKRNTPSARRRNSPSTRKSNTPSARKRNTPKTQRRNSPKTRKRNSPSARKRNSPSTRKHKSVSRLPWRG